MSFGSSDHNPSGIMLQTGLVHAGLCEEPAKALEHLLDPMVW
ncbi:DUF3037 domain-containing protein [Stigmatella aurantiaca]|nr:DUF3037 domain-containing protein [Stigmatella aurantiaca]